MSVFDNREGRTFIIVVALVSFIALAGGIWAVRTVNQKDTMTLGQLYKNYEELERAYRQEMDNIDAEVLSYDNPDSVKAELNKVLGHIQKEKNFMNENPDEVIKRIDEFHAASNRYQRKLTSHIRAKDNYTSQEIGKLNGQIEEYKAQLDKILKQNRSLSYRLNTMIKRFKGAEAELNVLRSQKVRLDSMLAQQDSIRQEFDSMSTDRERLRDLLAQSEELVRKQQEEIERLKGITSKAYNFLAHYEYNNRNVILDATGRHRKAQVGKELLITFDVGESLFEGGDDTRQVYLTLYKDGQPYLIIKNPVRVDANNKVNYKAVLAQNLESADYYFELTYQEEPIMADYKFRIK